MSKKLDRAIRLLLLVPFVAAMIIYGSTKPEPHAWTITFDTRYIMNTGSYLMNDVCHVELQRTSTIVPLDSNVLVYARQIGLTNSTDWVQLLPVRTIEAHMSPGCDYALENATNYNVNVTVDYVPPSPVITNKLLEAQALITKGFMPILPESGIKLVVPQMQFETENSNE